MLVFYLLLVNLFTFFLFAEDKKRAKKTCGGYRNAPLYCLHYSAVQSGALAGMYVFRHKTKKWKFRIGIPLILGMQMILFGVGIYVG